MRNLEKLTTIIAVPNYGRKTFTLRKVIKGVTIAKYRTNAMTKEEFEDSLLNTSEDWRNYLRRSEDYYFVDH